MGATIALNEDREVWTWGANHFGQLGIGVTGAGESSKIPVQVKSPLGGESFLIRITDVAAGSAHMVALDIDGNVWTWGWNKHGQLGDGTNDTRNLPVQVKGVGKEEFLEDVEAIAVGLYHTVALDTDGRVRTWGQNNYGQLGDGTDNDKNSPVRVKALEEEASSADIEEVFAGGHHSIALDKDSSVWIWGSNDVGQLGDGTSVNYKTTPVKVKLSGEEFPEGIIALAGGA